MHGHEVIASKKKVDVARRETVLLLLEIDAVQDQVQIALIGLDLGKLNLAGRVLDGQRMEVKRVHEDALNLLARGRHQIYPQHDLRRGVEPGRLDPLDASRPAVLVDVDTDHVGFGLQASGFRLRARTAACFS